MRWYRRVLYDSSRGHSLYYWKVKVSDAKLVRCLDILLSLIGLLSLAPLLGLIFVILLAESSSPIFRQTRLGKDKIEFIMLKFRSMRKGTKEISTHLIDGEAITPMGKILRQSKLDELPQLWNVFRGDMSFVGPRPCLPNQLELITQRESRGIFAVRPGITGLAQISKVDMSDPKYLVKLDSEMLHSFGVGLYFYCIVSTVLGKSKGNRFPES